MRSIGTTIRLSCALFAMATGCGRAGRDIPTPPEPGEEALVPVGVPSIFVDDVGGQGGPPEVVWADGVWGASWSSAASPRDVIRLHVLGADGNEVAPPVVVGTGRSSTSTSIDFAGDQYAIVVTGRVASMLAIADRDGALVPPWVPMPAARGLDVARDALNQGWVAVLSMDDESNRLDAIVIGDGATATGEPLALPHAMPAYDARIATVGTRSIAAWTSGDGVHARLLGGRPLATISGDIEVMSAQLLTDAKLEAEVYGDRVLFGATDGEHVLVASLDPATAAVDGPFVVGDTGIVDRRVGIAPVPERGFYVVCYGRGLGPAGGSDGHDGVSLQVMSEDGARWGAPLALVPDIPNIGGVDCAWNGEEIFVIWWSAALDPNEVWSTRVRPTFL